MPEHEFNGRTDWEAEAILDRVNAENIKAAFSTLDVKPDSVIVCRVADIQNIDQLQRIAGQIKRFFPDHRHLVINANIRVIAEPPEAMRSYVIRVAHSLFNNEYADFQGQFKLPPEALVTKLRDKLRILRQALEVAGYPIDELT